MISLLVNAFFIISYPTFPQRDNSNVSIDSQNTIKEIRNKIDNYILENKYVVKDIPGNEQIMLKPIQTFIISSQAKYIILLRLTSEGQTKKKIFDKLFKQVQEALISISKPDEEVECIYGIEVNRTGRCYI